MKGEPPPLLHAPTSFFFPLVSFYCDSSRSCIFSAYGCETKSGIPALLGLSCRRVPPKEVCFKTRPDNVGSLLFVTNTYYSLLTLLIVGSLFERNVFWWDSLQKRPTNIGILLSVTDPFANILGF